MKVVKAFPPNYRAINDAFNVRGRDVIFCFGDRIYNPSGILIGPDLLAHEQVHSDRQASYAGGVDAWWHRYVASRSRTSAWPRKFRHTRRSSNTGRASPAPIGPCAAFDLPWNFIGCRSPCVSLAGFTATC